MAIKFILTGWMQALRPFSLSTMPRGCSRPVRRPAKAAVWFERQKNRILQRLQSSHGRCAGEVQQLSRLLSCQESV